MHKKFLFAIGLIVCLVPPMFGTSVSSSEHSSPPFATEPRLSAGAAHSLGVRPDGSVWGWGSNQFGQVGDGTTTSRMAPMRVAGIAGASVDVTAGATHSLAVNADGSVWAWGFNGDGQLGDGTTARRLLPVRVSTLTNVVAVAAGGTHSLALESDGTVWAWGRNEEGQLGDRTKTRRLRPVRVANLTGATAIAAGTLHSLAVLSDGTVRAWGANVTGQLGDGTYATRTSPVRVSIVTGIQSVSAGGSHSLALRSDGTVWGWGWNTWGQIGDGTRTTRTKPVQAVGVYEATSISAGGVHSLALTTDQTAWAWGNNFFGQLGEGSRTQQHLPVPLSGPNLAWGAAPPIFSPESGTYSEPLWVTASTPTPGATVHYTTSGDDPTENDPVLLPEETLFVDQTTTLKARAFKGSLAPSAVTTAVYTMMSGTPVISPGGGTYAFPQSVWLWTSTPMPRYATRSTAPTRPSSRLNTSARSPSRRRRRSRRAASDPDGRPARLRPRPTSSTSVRWPRRSQIRPAAPTVRHEPSR